MLDADRFTASRPIRIRRDFSELSFSLESDNRLRHQTKVHLSGLSPGPYIVRDGGRFLVALDVKNDHPVIVELPMEGAGLKSFTVVRQRKKTP